MKLYFKKILILSAYSLLSLNVFSQTTIVSWDFPGNPDNAIADGGTAVNAAETIITVGGTSAVDFATGGITTQAANATGWNGGNASKYWQIDFVTTGFSSINVSSVQRGSNTGPRDFRLEYKVGAGAWTVVAGGTIIVANNFTSGVLNNLVLPAACNNQAQVFLRWIMTTNEDVNAGATNVVAGGTSRIDGIVVEGTCTPATPACATYSLPTNGSSFCPSSQTLSWSALATPTCGSITYDVYFNAGATATTIVSTAQTGLTYVTGALTGGTTYSWKIVPKNGTVTAVGCSTFSFTTSAVASNSIAPLTDNFESCLNWTVVNGAQTNIWVQGTATDNGGAQSMYITNDGGTTNAYNNSITSVTHFYKDIAFPAGQPCITLTFDWKANGESTFDFLKVFAIATSSTPVAGTQVSSGLLGTLNLQTTYQTTSIVLPAAYAGTTQRLVFSWRNDNSLGANPAAAIDNIDITTGAVLVSGCVTGAIFPIDGTSTLCSSTTSLNLTWTAPTVLGCNAATGYNLFFGTNNPPTNLINGTAIGNVTTFNVAGLVSTNTYYWQVVPTNSIGSATGCSTYTFSFAAGSAPANDLPCNAVDIPLGTIASGDNSCAANTGEPATPACWTGGSVNTVWFSFTAPSTGNVKIRTAPGTLLNTQIAVFSGACGAGMTMVATACNKDAPNCGSTSVLLSELSLTGLTNGTTYYIAIDGEASLDGTFALTVIESSSTYPVSSGQTCASSILACNSAISIGNPGFQGIGFTCDDTGASNCTTGERGSVWYTINIANNGNLNFTILPNDYDPANVGAETDYDFVLWKTSGAGSINCTSISTSGGASVTACNYSGFGVTGVSPGGNAPAPYNASYDAAYEPSIPAVAGETYVLLIENFSNSTSGFSLDLSGSGPGIVNYAPPTIVTWTGGANTNTWTSAINWGGCVAPSCGIDAIVSTSSSFQPLISSAMGTVTVNNLTIDPGAILTLGPNAVLNICGNLTNNGSIVANASSIITFADNATHTLNGTLSGSSTLGSIVITDPIGGANCTLQANTSIELKGNFTTSNATSIFNLNGNNFLITGDFNNAAGATTFSNAAGSTITFKGTTAQTYNPNANAATPTLTLNNVVISNSGTGVTLSTTNTPNMIIGTSGVLTLTSGKIITPNNQEVTVMNTANAAVSAGNTTSYVQGNLRKYLAAGATGSFDFPVGHATPGYERANILFTSAAAAGAIQLVARFDPWGGAWPLPTAPNWTECATTYNDPFLNNGYWTINASSPSTGLYDLTLYNLSYTTSSTAFSIVKSPSAAPSWTLNGTCSASPVTGVMRQGMSGFSKMATVQGGAPLPVELISFSAFSEGIYNSINWKSAMEVNFRHYELESSEDGINFNKITTVLPLGNMSSYNNYNYLDFNYFKPITYYRLKMVDLDYSYEYSNIVSVEYGINKTEKFVVYPNPASNELFVSIVAPGEKEAIIDIKDILARTIHQQKIDLTHGFENTYINTGNFATGTYILNVSYGNSFSENIKVIISNKN